MFNDTGPYTTLPPLDLAPTGDLNRNRAAPESRSLPLRSAVSLLSGAIPTVRFELPNLDRALRRQVARSLPSVAGGMAILYAGYGLAHLLIPRGETRLGILLFAIASSLLFLAIALIGRKRRVPTDWANPLAFLFASTAIAHVLVQMRLGGDLYQTLNIVILVVAAGIFVLSTPWLVLIQSATFVSWWLLLDRTTIDGHTQSKMVFSLMAGMLLSMIVHLLRVKTLGALESVHLVERQRQFELEHALRRAARNEERFALSARGANDGLWDWDLQMGVVFYSGRWCEMLGADNQDLEGPLDHWMTAVHPEDRDRLLSDIESHLKGETPHFECSHRLLHEDGHYIWFMGRGIAVRDAEGNAVRMAGSLTDVTARVTYDQLTGLPNRTLLVDRIAQALERTRRNSKRRFAVFQMNLNQFKIVNESYGRDVGNRLLIDVAQRIERKLGRLEISSSASTSLSRSDGDEFTILLDTLDEEVDLRSIAAQLLEILEEPFDLEATRLWVEACIGVAEGSASLTSAEEVLRQAKSALHAAKEDPAEAVAVFDPGMLDQARNNLKIKTELRRALERDELVVHYQPIFSLQTGRVGGFEALVRWQHPEEGLIPPVQFIPIAEESELILAIDQWVLAKSCRQVLRWQRSTGQKLALHCNVSAKAFSKPGLADRTQAILVANGFAPDNLVLEITESLLIDPQSDSTLELAKLRDLGVRISLDDFGTGYSSLSHLHRLPIDRLKIDRSFVSELLEDSPAPELIRAIMSLSDYLGVEVIAEGVETVAQKERLQAMGCHLAQGYLFARPLPASEVPDAMLTEPLMVASSTLTTTSVN